MTDRHLRRYMTLSALALAGAASPRQERRLRRMHRRLTAQRRRWLRKVRHLSPASLPAPAG